VAQPPSLFPLHMCTVEKCRRSARQQRLTDLFPLNWPISEAVLARVRCLDGVARGLCAAVTAEIDTRRVLQGFLRGSEGPPNRVPPNAQVLYMFPPRSPFSRLLIFILYIIKVAGIPAPVHRLTGICASWAGGSSTSHLALRGQSRRTLN